MNELHLFAGAGGGILGGMLLGHTCVCAVEIEPYRRKVLLQRQRDGILPKFPIWDDVRTFDGTPWKGLVECVCAGSPCQGFSTSGDMLGTDHEESKLLWEVSRIVGQVRPGKIMLENVPAISFRALGTFCGQLAKMGYDTRTGVIGACCAGMDHMRHRQWMVADSMQERREEMVRQRENSITEDLRRTATNADTPAHRISRLEKRLGKPGVLGVNDGLAHRVDRLEAIGDGQVPAVVKLAWETLSQ